MIENKQININPEYVILIKKDVPEIDKYTLELSNGSLVVLEKFSYFYFSKYTNNKFGFFDLEKYLIISNGINNLNLNTYNPLTPGLEVYKNENDFNTSLNLKQVI